MVNRRRCRRRSNWNRTRVKNSWINSNLHIMNFLSLTSVEWKDLKQSASWSVYRRLRSAGQALVHICISNKRESRSLSAETRRQANPTRLLLESMKTWMSLLFSPKSSRLSCPTPSSSASPAWCWVLIDSLEVLIATLLSNNKNSIRANHRLISWVMESKRVWLLVATMMLLLAKLDLGMLLLLWTQSKHLLSLTRLLRKQSLKEAMYLEEALSSAPSANLSITNLSSLWWAPVSQAPSQSPLYRPSRGSHSRQTTVLSGTEQVRLALVSIPWMKTSNRLCQSSLETSNRRASIRSLQLTSC